MNSFAQAVTAIAVGAMTGFLGVGVLARGVDAWEASRCPEVTRIRVNTNTLLKDWASYAVCPREGLVTPLKP